MVDSVEREVEPRGGSMDGSEYIHSGYQHLACGRGGVQGLVVEVSLVIIHPPPLPLVLLQLRRLC